MPTGVDGSDKVNDTLILTQLRYNGMGLVPFAPTLSKTNRCEVMILTNTVERGWNRQCIGNLPGPLSAHYRI